VYTLSTESHAVAKQITDRVVAAFFDLTDTQDESGGLKFISLIDDSTDIWEPEDLARLQPLSDIAVWSNKDDLQRKISEAA
jgi:hypothetical protein